MEEEQKDHLLTTGTGRTEESFRDNSRILVSPDPFTPSKPPRPAIEEEKEKEDNSDKQDKDKEISKEHKSGTEEGRAPTMATERNLLFHEDSKII